jgi:hypothetical protein
MVTRRLRPREHEAEQIPTMSTSALWIMSQPSFALGVADVRAGRGTHRDYDLWNTNAQWHYERGRAWATLTPRHIQLRHNGKISSEAFAWFKYLCNDII